MTELKLKALALIVAVHSLRVPQCPQWLKTILKVFLPQGTLRYAEGGIITAPERWPERLLLISLILIPYLCSAEKPESQISQSKIVLGAILPLTGDGAGVGESIKNGMIWALSDLSPEQRENIEVRWEDDQMTPRYTLSAFDKLMRKGDVDILITFSAQSSSALAPLAERERIPLFAISSQAITSRDRSYVMLYWITPEEVANSATQEAVKRGYRSVARISAIHEGRLALKENLNRSAAGKMTWTFDEDYPVDTRDFRPFLIKMRNRKDVDAIAINLFFGQTGLFAKQARELSITLPLFCFEPCADQREQKLASGGLAGSWYVSPSAASEEFLTRYHEKFPGASDYAAAYGYDTISLLAAADRQGLTSRDQLNTFIHTVREFPGKMGNFYSGTDNRFRIPGGIRVVK
jgi:branched-chain amino acid transport system substrate-binding protein